MKSLCFNLVLFMAISLLFAACSEEQVGIIDNEPTIERKAGTSDYLSGEFSLGKGTVSWKTAADHIMSDCPDAKPILVQLNPNDAVNGTAPTFDIRFDRFGNYSLEYFIYFTSVSVECASKGESYLVDPPSPFTASKESGKYTLISDDDNEFAGDGEVVGIQLENEKGGKTTLEFGRSIEGNLSEAESLQFILMNGIPMKVHLNIMKQSN